MKPFLTVYGHVSIDQIMTVVDFPLENTSVDVTSDTLKLGGTASNVASVASSLGVPTALCSFVGDDFPEKFENVLRSKELIMDEFYRIKNYQTSRAIVVNDSKLAQKVLFYQGPQGHASELGIVPLKNAEKSEYVHFCTGEPKFTIEIMKKLKGKVKNSFDPAQEIHALWNEKSFNEALLSADILFSNQYEAKSILKYLGRNSFDGFDFPLVFTTKGIDGCDVFIKGKKKSFPIVKSKKTVDATGAGDAFRGGLYAGLYRKMSLDESIIIAASVSSFIVEGLGAVDNIPTWDMVLERAESLLSEL